MPEVAADVLPMKEKVEDGPLLAPGAPPKVNCEGANGAPLAAGLPNALLVVAAAVFCACPVADRPEEGVADTAGADCSWEPKAKCALAAVGAVPDACELKARLGVLVGPRAGAACSVG